jgi:type IV pilus assembly protein PilA
MVNGNLEIDRVLSIPDFLFPVSRSASRATLTMIAGSTAPGPKMNTPHHGFTLIEMVVVMAIIAILALMLVPTYQDKIVRDQIVEALPLADIAKKRVEASWSAIQAFPRNNASAGLPPADKIVSNYISATSVQDGAIHITFGNSANGVIMGKTLSIRPAIVADAPVVPIAWVCGNATVPDKMTAKGKNKTDIPTSYLPFNCRARSTTKPAKSK